jgi:uncharacterized protein YjbI with pentapeptide repeats
VPTEPAVSPPRIPSRKPLTRQPWTGEKLLDGDSHATQVYERVDLSGQDLRHSTFSECAFLGCNLTDTDVTGTHLVESDLAEIESAHLPASRSLWRHSSLARSRLGAVEAYEASFDGLVVADTKISYLNARSATWKDVLLQRCVIDELDLVGAKLARVRFESCQIGSLDLTRTTNADVDLRGAELRQISGLTGLAGCTISPEQLDDLSGPLASQLGITVRALSAD